MERGASRESDAFLPSLDFEDAYTGADQGREARFLTREASNDECRAGRRCKRRIPVRQMNGGDRLPHAQARMKREGRMRLAEDRANHPRMRSVAAPTAQGRSATPSLIPRRHIGPFCSTRTAGFSSRGTARNLPERSPQFLKRATNQGLERPDRAAGGWRANFSRKRQGYVWVAGKESSLPENSFPARSHGVKDYFLGSSFFR